MRPVKKGFSQRPPDDRRRAEDDRDVVARRDIDARADARAGAVEQPPIRPNDNHDAEHEKNNGGNAKAAKSDQARRRHALRYQTKQRHVLSARDVSRTLIHLPENSGAPVERSTGRPRSFANTIALSLAPGAVCIGT